MKKFIGILFFVVDLFVLIGLISNGAFVSAGDSAIENAGVLVGVFLPILANIFAGIFLIRFDSVYKSTYFDGFVARKKQCSKIVLFIVIYGILTFLALLGANASNANNYLVAIILSALPYFVPLMVFVIMLSMYAIPYWSCKKNLKLDDQNITEYLGAEETFYTYIDDESVLASDKAIFFPKMFCVIPFEQIASIKLYKALEKDIIFTLITGKKIEIVASEKQYNSVMKAFNNKI